MPENQNQTETPVQTPVPVQVPTPAPVQESPQEIEVLGAGTSDIVLTVPHIKVVKTSVRPFRMVIDDEPGTEEVAKMVRDICGCVVVINRTTVDLNKSPRESFIDGEKRVHKIFFDKIKELNPKLVIDIHGMANVGTMFNNAKIDGTRYFRRFDETRPDGKKVIGIRPDIDLQYGRKSGYTSATSKVVVGMAKRLVKRGIVVDFESTYPGGYVIRKVAGYNTQALAVEMSKRIRDTYELKMKVAESIADFIREFRGEVVEDVLLPEDFINTDAIWQQMARDAGLDPNNPQYPGARPTSSDGPGGYA